MICIDYTSKCVESKALTGKTAEGVVQFRYELVCHFGAARIHISDQRREFVNRAFVHFCSYKVNTCILSCVVYDQEHHVSFVIKNCLTTFIYYFLPFFIFSTVLLPVTLLSMIIVVGVVGCIIGVGVMDKS